MLTLAPQHKHASNGTRKSFCSPDSLNRVGHGVFELCILNTKTIGRIANMQLLTMAQGWQVMHRYWGPKTTALGSTKCVRALQKHSKTIICAHNNNSMHLSTCSNSSSLRETFDWSYSVCKTRKTKKHLQKLQSLASRKALSCTRMMVYSWGAQVTYSKATGGERQQHLQEMTTWRCSCSDVTQVHTSLGGLTLTTHF